MTKNSHIYFIDWETEMCEGFQLLTSCKYPESYESDLCEMHDYVKLYIVAECKKL